MRILCIICFFINIMLAITAVVSGTGYSSIALALICAGLCLASAVRMGK